MSASLVTKRGKQFNLEIPIMQVMHLGSSWQRYIKWMPPYYKGREPHKNKCGWKCQKSSFFDGCFLSCWRFSEISIDMSLEVPPSCAGFLYTHIHSINNDDLLYGAVLNRLIQSHLIFLFTTGLHCILFVTGSRLMLFLGARERTFPNTGLICGTKG